MLRSSIKKTIVFLGWFFVFLTILSLVLTWLTNYQFTHRFQQYFTQYRAVQWCILLTMISWGINFLLYKSHIKYKIYAGICLIIALGTLFFMSIGVY